MGKITADSAMAEFGVVIADGFSSVVPSDLPRADLWRLEIAPSAKPFLADPDTQVVRVSPRGLAGVWCMTAYAVRLADCIRIAAETSPELDVHNIGRDVAGWKMFVNYAIQLQQGDEPWPSEIPHPNPALLDGYWGKVNHVFLGAVTWLLLHEIGHLALDHVVEAAGNEKWAQEDEADLFATQQTFKSTSRKDRPFWVVSVGAAYVWLLLFHSFADRTHPPGHTRIRNFWMSADFKADDMKDEWALEIVCHLIKATFLPEIQQPPFSSSDEFLKWLLEQLRSP